MPMFQEQRSVFFCSYFFLSFSPDDQMISTLTESIVSPQSTNSYSISSTNTIKALLKVNTSSVLQVKHYWDKVKTSLHIPHPPQTKMPNSGKQHQPLAGVSRVGERGVTLLPWKTQARVCYFSAECTDASLTQNHEEGPERAYRLWSQGEESDSWNPGPMSLYFHVVVRLSTEGIC